MFETYTMVGKRCSSVVLGYDYFKLCVTKKIMDNGLLTSHEYVHLECC